MVMSNDGNAPGDTMMNTLRTGLLLLVAMSFAACASMSEDECRTADWRTIGYEDGAAGASATALGHRREACADIPLGRFGSPDRHNTAQAILRSHGLYHRRCVHRRLDKTVCHSVPYRGEQ